MFLFPTRELTIATLIKLFYSEVVMAGEACTQALHGLHARLNWNATKNAHWVSARERGM